MKNFSFFIVAASALIALDLSPARADVLSKETITITGTIEQQIGLGTTSVGKKPITLARILALLGITDVKAQDMAYFYDQDTQAIVIAPKTAKTGDNVTPVATVVTFSDPTTVVVENNNLSTRVANVTVLNGQLSGISYGHYLYVQPRETDTNHLISTGTINSAPTVVKMVVQEKFKVANATE